MAGRSIHESAPDLFSTPREDASASPVSAPTSVIPENDLPRHVLPNDLPNAVKNLTDRELDQLSTAVLIEQQRRGKKPPSNENAQKRRIEEVSVPMSTGKGECSACCIQSRTEAIANCAAVQNFTSGSAEGAGGRWVREVIRPVRELASFC